MQKNRHIPCYAPQYYFEIPTGLTIEDLEDFARFFQNHYQAQIDQELELVRIPGHFAYHLMPHAFLGFLWMSKVRRAEYDIKQAPERTQTPNKRSLVFPVGKLVVAQANAPNQDAILWDFLKQKGATKWRQSANLSPKMRTLYYNIYALSYYQYMAPVEKNPLLQKVWQFRASYNKKYVWRWQYGTYFWGIKPRAGQQMLTL